MKWLSRLFGGKGNAGGGERKGSVSKSTAGSGAARPGDVVSRIRALAAGRTGATDHVVSARLDAAERATGLTIPTLWREVAEPLYQLGIIVFDDELEQIETSGFHDDVDSRVLRLDETIWDNLIAVGSSPEGNTLALDVSSPLMPADCAVVYVDMHADEIVRRWESGAEFLAVVAQTMEEGLKSTDNRGS